MIKFSDYLKKNKTTINLFCALLAIGINLLINFFLSPYIVKNIGVEANGFIQLAYNFVTIASLITIALNSMAGRFISLSYHRKEIEKANEYYSSIVIGNALIIALLIVPSLVVVDKLEYLVNISEALIIDVKLLFLFVFANFFISCINSILNIAEFVTNEVYICQIVNVVANITRAICIILLFSLCVPHVFFSGIAVCLSSIVIAWILFIAKVKILPDIKFSFKKFKWKYIRELVTSGIWNTVNQCGSILNTGLDLLLTNVFLNQFDMGILSISKIIPTVIVSLVGTIDSVYTAELTVLYAKEDKEAFINKLKSSMKIGSILISIPMMMIIVLGIRFYRLWQPQLDAPILAILSIIACVALIPMAGPQTLFNVFTVTNKIKINSLIVVGCGVLNIIFVVLLMKYTEYELIAIAGVSTILQILRNMLFTVPYAARCLHLKWNYFYKDVLISILCCSVSGLIFFLLAMIIKYETWYALIAVGGIGAILSFSINTYIVFNKEERNSIFKSLFGNARE